MQMASSFCSVENCTVEGNVAKLVVSKIGIVCTDQSITENQVISIKIAKKLPYTLDSLSTSLKVGFTPEKPMSNFELNDWYDTYQDGRKFEELDVGKSLSFTLFDNCVCIFIDGILMDKKPFPPSYSTFWPVIKFSGVFTELNLQILRQNFYNKYFICSRSTLLYPRNCILKNGTQVKLLCLVNKRPAKGEYVWIEEINSSVKGWMNTDFLERVPRENKSHSFSEALNSGFILCRVTRIICVGPPGAGKTSLKQLLLKRKVPSRCESTSILTAPSVSQQIDDQWVVINDDDNDTVFELMAESAVAKPQPTSTEGQYHDVKEFFKVSRSSSVPKINIESSLPINPVVSLPSDIFKCHTAVESTSKRLQGLIALKSKAEFTDDSSKQLVYFYDSGGQPQFLDLLPIFIRSGIVVMIVANISLDLDSNPPFFFYENGEDSSLPVSVLPQSSIEIIQSAARMVSSFTCAHPNSDRKQPSFLVVGTHVDKIPWLRRNATINSIDNRLRESLHDVQDLRVDFNEKEGKIIFPINVLDDKLNIAGTIRTKIQQAGMALELKIPLAWYFFEVSLTEYTEKCKRQIVTVKECIEIGAKIKLDDSDVVRILKYFHSVNKYMYYPEYMENIVITDPEVVLQMLTLLLKITFCDTKLPLPLGAITTLKEKGIFTKDVFDICLKADSCNFLPEFQPLHLRELLVRLMVIANIDGVGIEYFIPSALTRASDLDKIQSDFLINFSALFLLPKKGIVLHGVFTSLIIYLLSLKSIFTLPKGMLQYRNAITLSYESGGGCVLLIDKFRWLEVCYSGNIGKRAFNIRKTIMKGLKEILSVLPYSPDDVNFQYGFLCKKCPIPCPQHPAVVNSLHPFTTTCTKDPLKSGEEKKTDTQHSWLFNLDECREPNPRDLLNQVASKLEEEMWWDLGIQLKLNTVTMNNIRADDRYNNMRHGRYLRMFEEWKRTDCSPYKWDTILNALKSLTQHHVHKSLLNWLTENFPLEY